MHMTKTPQCNQAKLCGASGADNGFYNTRGGRGARVKESVQLQNGTQLRVLARQEATGRGGGRGTFVVFAADGKLLAAAGGGGAVEVVDGDPGQASAIGSVNGGSKGKGGKVCVSDAAFQSLVGDGGGGGLITNGRCYEDGQCNKPCPGNDRGKSFSAAGVGGYNKKAGCGAGGLGDGGNCGGGGGAQVVVLKWTGRPKIWILAALVEEVRLHLIITGLCCLEIAPWETVLLRLS